jgi:hypothetical protein
MFVNESFPLRRWLLRALIGSILFGASLGLAAVLRDEWSWFEVRVLLTAATIAVASVAGLACDLARSSRRANVIPWVGLVLTVVAASMFLIGIWPESESELHWKATGCVAAFAAAAVQVCLLAMARLSRRYAWVFLLAMQVAFGLATVIAAIIIFEPRSEGVWQVVAALAIVDAALVLIVPVLHRMSRLDEPGEGLISPLGEQNLAAIDAELDRLRRRIRHLESLRAETTGDAASGETFSAAAARPPSSQLSESKDGSQFRLAPRGQ